MNALIRRLHAEEEGATAVEYGIVIGVIALPINTTRLPVGM